MNLLLHSSRLHLASLLAAALTASYPRSLHAQNQRDFSQVQVKNTTIAGSVHLIEGAGGNIAILAGPDGVLVIDTQFAPLAPRLDAAIKQISTNRIEYVVNTHVHPDHVGGNAYFGRQARIVAHKNLRKRLAARNGITPGELPVITHENGLSFIFNNEEVRVLGFGPGHTDGDSAVYFTNAKVLHVGDQFVVGRFPFVDVANGGDVRGLVKNIDSLLAWVPEDAKIVPGHGPISPITELKKFREFVQASINAVEADIAAGKSVNQIKANSFLEKYKEWNNGGRWLEAVHASLTGKAAVSS